MAIVLRSRSVELGLIERNMFEPPGVANVPKLNL